MANAPITTSATGIGASGINSLLSLFMAQFNSIKRAGGRPIAYMNTDASSTLAKYGQTANVPLYSNVNTTLISDGNAVSLDDTTGSSVTVTLNKHRVTKFSATQIVQALTAGDQSVINNLIGARIASLLNDIEADILSLATTGFTSTVKGSYNTALTESVITDTMASYMSNLPPRDVLPTFLVRHDLNAWGALLQLSAFRDWQVTGQVSPTATDPYLNQGVKRYGANFVVTQSLPKSGTSIDNVLFHPNAICVAMRQFEQPISPGVQAIPMVQDGIAFQMLLQWNGDRLADEIAIHSLYGFAAGRQEWGAQVKS